jgi:hypothetical protein
MGLCSVSPVLHRVPVGLAQVRLELLLSVEFGPAKLAAAPPLRHRLVRLVLLVARVLRPEVAVQVATVPGPVLAVRALQPRGVNLETIQI